MNIKRIIAMSRRRTQNRCRVIYTLSGNAVCSKRSAEVRDEWRPDDVADVAGLIRAAGKDELDFDHPMNHVKDTRLLTVTARQAAEDTRVSDHSSHSEAWTVDTYGLTTDPPPQWLRAH